jgi:hypothetical protein
MAVSIKTKTVPRLATTSLVIALLWSQACIAAEKMYPLISYKCDADADIIEITNSLLKNGQGANFKYSDEDGTYSPWDMVEIAQKSDATRIIRTNKITRVCNLSSGDYTIEIEPQVFNKDLNGRCGASISGAVTILHDGIELLERTAFEDYCHGNAPIITRITVFGKTIEYKIKRIAKYKFY